MLELSLGSSTIDMSLSLDRTWILSDTMVVIIYSLGVIEMMYLTGVFVDDVELLVRLLEHP